MLVFERIKSSGLSTAAMGVGALALLPVVVPVIATRLARPLFKGAVKGSLICLDKGQEAMMEMGEVLKDVVAEARSELESGTRQANPLKTPVAHPGTTAPVSESLG